MNERIQKLEDMFGAVVSSMDKISNTLTNQMQGKVNSEIKDTVGVFQEEKKS